MLYVLYLLNCLKTVSYPIWRSSPLALPLQQTHPFSFTRFLSSVSLVPPFLFFLDIRPSTFDVLEPPPQLPSTQPPPSTFILQVSDQLPDPVSPILYRCPRAVAPLNCRYREIRLRPPVWHFKLAPSFGYKTLAVDRGFEFWDFSVWVAGNIRRRRRDFKSEWIGLHCPGQC